MWPKMLSFTVNYGLANYAFTQKWRHSRLVSSVINCMTLVRLMQLTQIQVISGKMLKRSVDCIRALF